MSKYIDAQYFKDVLKKIQSDGWKPPSKAKLLGEQSLSSAFWTCAKSMHGDTYDRHVEYWLGSNYIAYDPNKMFLDYVLDWEFKISHVNAVIDSLNQTIRNAELEFGELRA